MKKELISRDNLDSFINKDDGKLYLGSGRLLTPGAKDELARRNVAIVYGEPPASEHTQQDGCGCGRGAKGGEGFAREAAAWLRRSFFAAGWGRSHHDA